MIFGSLFSGVGGFDLGMERAGHRCAWFAEIDPWASRVLAHHWPGVPNHGDVSRIDYARVEPVDALVGGFPCQDISAANVAKREGLAGAKSGLWHQFARAVQELRPRYVGIENVDTNGEPWVPSVRRHLARLGYSSTPALRMRADRMGYNHGRRRLFVVAYADSESEPPRAVHAAMAGIRENARRDRDGRTPPAGALRVADGLAGEMDRLRLTGNAVMPCMGERIGRLITALDESQGAQ